MSDASDLEFEWVDDTHVLVRKRLTEPVPTVDGVVPEDGVTQPLDEQSPETKAEWGEDDPRYISRVKGEWGFDAEKHPPDVLN